MFMRRLSGGYETSAYWKETLDVLQKDNITEHLQLVKDHTDKPTGHLQNVLWENENQIDWKWNVL